MRQLIEVTGFDEYLLIFSFQHTTEISPYPTFPPFNIFSFLSHEKIGGGCFANTDIFCFSCKLHSMSDRNQSQLIIDELTGEKKEPCTCYFPSLTLIIALRKDVAVGYIRTRL